MPEGQSVLSDDGRNVHFFDSSTDDMLGGVFQNGSITEANFIDMLNIVLVIEPQSPVAPRSLTVRARSGQTISRTSQPLTPGDYDIHVSDGHSMKLSDEPFVRRLLSYSISGRELDFKNGVRARDGKCVFTGIVNPRAHLNKWASWEAAHIFPLEKEGLWIANNFSRWITNADSGGHSAPIHSIQNGFLLKAGIHQLFDDYSISVNPDDNYKITSFIPDADGVDGRILDLVCRDPADPNRVSDNLLRWHFRQSVLGNMRGAGEPSFEHDFPPGSDMLKEIYEGPFPVERFEMELSSRLRGRERGQGLV
ncbi:hypothetical protein ASPZODRAFT_77930 [Penicilliopsis zonata CBS 506.65]|uniref:Uncharacterized protein n=1 Tax=Penicilliopsis zonata CBS 506.65 TaxID=1073090 RepID=A0A1L9S4D6_9EURO|nr:hypothetical protein ASPZODRAFT_77930 [Penicilliopsis zonata CBS 506.65]OJJ42028.1 hypothetical protein ASPZODRAFT_77930 [Penicilliopsis zonata CBS 506.65]